ncbi:hypothetical protein HGM15179_022545, partial [Zosterops borbonicus]
ELLDYIDRVVVQERVMDRVRRLSHLLASPSIVQVLQDYLFFNIVAVQERVMGRVRRLSHLLANPSIVQ